MRSLDYKLRKMGCTWSEYFFHCEQRTKSCTLIGNGIEDMNIAVILSYLIHPGLSGEVAVIAGGLEAKFNSAQSSLDFVPQV